MSSARDFQSSNEFRLGLFVCVAIVLFVVFYSKNRIFRYPSWAYHVVGGGTRARRRTALTRDMLGGNRLSLSSLNLLMTQRDFTGDDYELLSRLDDDEGGRRRRMGASEVEIDRLPTYSVHPPVATLQADNTRNDTCLSNCVICLEPFEEGNTNRILPCMHHFHQQCVDKWLLQHASCPVCKCPATG